MKKNKLILSAILIILASFIVFQSYTLLKGAEKGGGLSVVSSFEKKWKEKIEKDGAQKAYDDVKKEYGEKNPSEQHNAVHLFGSILYKTMGADGIGICDGVFSFGCYHGFFIEAVSDKGTASITELDKACVKKYGPLGLGCPHGIGHGLVEFVGHRPEKLVTALEDCEKLNWKKELFGCSSGVFMEYNFPTSSTSNRETELRKLNPDKPYEPCDSLPPRFQPSCYYEIGKWWTGSFDIPKIGELCGKINDAKNQKYCFMGIGESIASVDTLDLQSVIDSCKELGSLKGEIHCRAGASWIIFAVPERRNLSDMVCDGLSKADKATCINESNIMDLKGGGNG